MYNVHSDTKLNCIHVDTYMQVSIKKPVQLKIIIILSEGINKGLSNLE